MTVSLVDYSKHQRFLLLKGFHCQLICLAIHHFALKKASVILYFVGCGITEHIPCDFGLIALLLLGLMYGKLNHNVII